MEDTVKDQAIFQDVKTKCTVSKTFLDFNLQGHPCPVARVGDHNSPSVRDTVTLVNDSRHTVSFQFAPYIVSDKYTLTINPEKGILKKKKTVQIVFTLQVYCTTKISFHISMTLTPKESVLPFHKAHSPKSQPTILFSSKVDSELSSSIDYDELQMVEELASGGFGTVYKARWRGIDVAVKKMHAQDLTAEDLALYNREISLMKALSCPYIVTYMGSTQIRSQPVSLVMEFVKKGSLTKLIMETPIGAKLKAKILLDIAKGMSFLHNNNIFHRDLKPDNILLVSTYEDADVNIKITDFDTARAYLEPSGPESSTERMERWLGKSEKGNTLMVEERDLSKNMGTLVYKAPEIISGTTKYAIDKCDVYSYAVVVWQVWSQKKPFHQAPYHEMSGREIENFIMEGNRLPIGEEIPSRVADLITICWSQDPSARPTFGDICSFMEKILDCAEPSIGSPIIFQSDPVPRSADATMQKSKSTAMSVSSAMSGLDLRDNHSWNPLTADDRSRSDGYVGSNTIIQPPSINGRHVISPNALGRSPPRHTTQSAFTLRSPASTSPQRTKRSLSVSGEVAVQAELPLGYCGEMERPEAEHLLGETIGMMWDKKNDDDD
eukprot:TRINITY_DN5042_c0_g1_i1.p1 TRINITY_DN5042_c0_g1~~TRINITY_DN5042_c0_g1_i1.p1  ORF type:complete len:607 (+),score=122.68 TRINITY_DN5042_c0_g1_i1:203-2023(+)